MTAREILRKEYGDAPNFMTPDVVRRVKVKHPDDGREGAAEIAEGSGMPASSRIYGVSVVWVNPDGSTERDYDRSRCFNDHGEVFYRDNVAQARGDDYRAAVSYVRDLGARI